MNSMSEIVEDYQSEFRRRVSKSFNRLRPDIIQNIVDTVIPDVEERYHEAIEAFYEDYLPNWYERKYSMYNMLKVEHIRNGGSDKLSIDVDDENMTTMRDGRSLFDIVYVGGWHGGPIWRYGGRVAKRMQPSPDQYFGNLLDIYNKHILPDIKQEIVQEWQEIILRDAGY